MLFQKKADRAMNWLKEQNEKELDESPEIVPGSLETEEYPINLPETEDYTDTDESEEFTKDSEVEFQSSPERKRNRKTKRNKKQEVKESRGLDLEKHDMTALVISAFLIFLPVALVILGIFAMISWLFF